jgi:large subunit ribosomal protein L29
MKAQDLRERSKEDLNELKGSMQKDLFFYRMKNAVGQLEDTSLIKKTRKDLARIEGVLSLAAAKDGGSNKAEGDKS